MTTLNDFYNTLICYLADTRISDEDKINGLSRMSTRCRNAVVIMKGKSVIPKDDLLVWARNNCVERQDPRDASDSRR